MNTLIRSSWALMELASARDNLADYGPQSDQASQADAKPSSVSVSPPRGSARLMGLLMALGDSEGHPGAIPGLQERASDRRAGGAPRNPGRLWQCWTTSATSWAGRATGSARGCGLTCWTPRHLPTTSTISNCRELLQD